MADKVTRYQVIKYPAACPGVGVIMSGMGRNAGTWDSEHSRSAAYRHARALRQADPVNRYKVEEV